MFTLGVPLGLSGHSSSIGLEPISKLILWLSLKVTYRRLKDTLISLSKGIQKGPAVELVPVLFGSSPPLFSKSMSTFNPFNACLDPSQVWVLKIALFWVREATSGSFLCPCRDKLYIRLLAALILCYYMALRELERPLLLWRLYYRRWSVERRCLRVLLQTLQLITWWSVYLPTSMLIQWDFLFEQDQTYLLSPFPLLQIDECLINNSSHARIKLVRMGHPARLLPQVLEKALDAQVCIFTKWYIWSRDDQFI